MEVRRSIFYSGLWPRVVVEVNRWFKRALVPVTSPKEEGKVTLQFRIIVTPVRNVACLPSAQ